jgi:hypothetical protein
VSASRLAQQRARDVAERRLTAEEVHAWLSAPISDEERTGVLELVRWFTKRYPTPLERLAYVRKAYARWTKDDNERRG